jgi:hypothetical protein
MLAGCLRPLGYFMGDDLISPTESNPKGFFEDHEIIRINEALMTRASPPAAFEPGRGWLAPVPLDVQLHPPRTLTWGMLAQAARAPFCFKDPRFCYTLPASLPLFDDPAVLCVFREPARTANSIVEESRRSYYAHLQISFDQALQLWTLMYRHLLGEYAYGGTFVFMHYEQVLDGSAAGRLSEVLGAEIDTSFPDAALRRSPATGVIGAEVEEIYDRLCALAEYAPEPAASI